ncbi:MAG: hypothetical protein M5U21_04410 [Fimbriimonadaceae bacterium]|nr:hypothetical protein [Fimbriimonadaceae bacterium]MCC6352123.1 hypothetical protein [Fimbriimonadaceae bacterium]MCZ7580053.1 hypothetical protein [Fimbriimonadaceae bacterium]
MRKLLRYGFWIVTIGILASHALAQGGKVIRPENPIVTAKRAEIRALQERARVLLRNDQVEQAISVLREATAIEASLDFGTWGVSGQSLARLYVKLGRTEEALEAYRMLFRWDKAGWVPSGWDLVGPRIPTMEYAILLAKAGRPEDAKAMYYSELRRFNGSGQRPAEPVPFLVVFDPEPEGVYWEYSPERLEAAALMIMALEGDSADFVTQEWTHTRDIMRRVRALAPDWFYPVMYLAAQNWRFPQGPELLALAESLARPGLERDLIAKYRLELAEHKAIIEAEDTPFAWDERPMLEGCARRSRMQCLRPNETILRRLSR